MDTPGKLDGFAGFSLKLGFCLSLMALVCSLQFFLVPRGEDIRPMGWAMVFALFAAVGLLLGVPCAIAGLFTLHWRRALVGIMFCLAPLPVSSGVMHLAALIKRFTIAP